MFGHLRSFKGWIQTEAYVIPSYHGMVIQSFTFLTQSISLDSLEVSSGLVEIYS